jgi:tetratricopeptide (TPR) repeat protein
VKVSAITLAAILATASTSAYADSALRPERIPNKARLLADKGRAFHNAGDYNSAVAAFKEAYVLAPSPGLLFNIAQAYRLAGNCDEAAWMYRRFLDTNPIGSHKTLAENHLAVVERCGSGGLLVQTPTPQPDATPIPESDTNKLITFASLPDRTRSGKYKKIGLGTAIGGGALLAGAAFFAIDANDAANTVSETYKRGGKWEDVKDADARGRRSSTIATVLGVGGGLAVVSGAVLFAVGRHYEQAQHVAVTPTTRGAQVSLSWGF